MSAPARPGASRLCRLDLWLNPVFDRIIGETPGISLSVLPARGDDARTLAGLRTAHAYHVSAAKDELPRQWFVTADLIRQCPELVCVSSGGAGYDTVDVAACTAAGIAVVNQCRRLCPPRRRSTPTRRCSPRSAAWSNPHACGCACVTGLQPRRP